MAKLHTERLLWVLVLGDLLALLIVTIFGFASHSELNAGARMLTTFLPLAAAWIMVAPFLVAYDPSRLADIRNIWRPGYAMLLAGPLAAWLRALLLGSAIIPVFVAVLSGVAALAILLWRVIFWALWARRHLSYG